MTPDQLVRAESLLSAKELAAVRKLGAGANRLSPQTAAQFYALWLQGYSTEDIARQNPSYGSYGLGLVASARIEYNWDQERERYVKDLMTQVQAAVTKSTLEGLQFASDGMAVFHRLVGDKFRRYLQTGDPKDLGDMENMGFKTYKDLVELLQKLTGQEGQQRVQAEVVHRVEEAPVTVQVVDRSPAGILKRLEEAGV